MKKTTSVVVDEVLEFWNEALFSVGTTNFTPRTIILFTGSVVLVFAFASLIKRILVSKIFKRYGLDKGVAESTGTIIRYLIVLIGLTIILQTSGIDLSALGILFGALGIGIGFGLQNISNNFISGIIILFERPVKLGDRVEVDGIAGNIVKISARATTIITNDNISIIVPNSDFINEKVINWSLNDTLIRFNFPVGVSYKEDPANIKKLLLEVAVATDGVLKEPSPDVLFEEFADSSLNFNLRVWSREFSDKPKVLKSKLYYAIFEKFKEHNIEIPFPQRDIHVIPPTALPENPQKPLNL